jgi:hypothetical protein
MHRKFRCVLELSAKIDDSSLKEDDIGNTDLNYIKYFIAEFLKDAKAIITYFKSYFIDTCISNDNDAFFQRIIEELDYRDYISLFFSIAEKCPEEVANFIRELYSDSKDKGDSEKIFKTQKLLVNHFGPIEVKKASFEEIQAKDEDKQGD